MPSGTDAHAAVDSGQQPRLDASRAGGSDSGDAKSGSDTGVEAGHAGPDGAGPVAELTKMCPAVSPGDYETYGLAPTMSLPTGISALTSWTENPASGGWNGRQVMDGCRYEADPLGFMTSHGKLSARVEVQPADDPLSLGENTERAELVYLQDATGTMIEESAASGTQYYATSYYFPTTWSATFYPYSVFEAAGTTWPAGTTTDCTSGDGNECNSWSFVMQFYPWAALAAGSTAPGAPETMWFSSGSSSFQFSDGGHLALGEWMDLVIEIDWATGAVTIWRRDAGESQFTQVVSAATTTAPPSGVYSKQGLYRGGNVNGRTDVYWVGPTARGATFAAVEQAAFGTSDGP